MGDIVDELRDRAYGHKAGDPLCERAATEIEGLRWKQKLHGNIVARLRLTDAEREAVEFFVGFHNEGYGAIEKNADTLRKLLERLA